MASDAQTAVLIAAYNAAPTLGRAVASALAQPETAEVCIVDDGSHDSTHSEAQAWAARDRRVVVLAQSNAGPSAARNVAIGATHAPWIAVLDADDYWLPGRLARLLAHAADADFVCDELIRVPEDGATPSPLSASVVGPAMPLSFEAFLLGNLGALAGPLDLGYLKPIFRRAFIEQHGLHYREDMRLGEDYELYGRSIALGARFLTCPPAGYISVERRNSLSTSHSEADLRRLRDCDDGLASVRALANREQRALRRHWNSVDCRLQWRRLISAVKTRDFGAAISTFRSPQTAAFLAARLGEQAWLRSMGFARRDVPAQAAEPFPQ